MKTNLFVNNYNYRIKENIKRIKKITKNKRNKKNCISRTKQILSLKKNLKKEIYIPEIVKLDIEKLSN